MLHDRLVEFLQDENNWPDANSVGSSAGNVFKKPNGQQIDSSRRYLAVRDSDDHIDLYVQITKGRNLGNYFQYEYQFNKYSLFLSLRTL